MRYQYTQPLFILFHCVKKRSQKHAVIEGYKALAPSRQYLLIFNVVTTAEDKSNYD